MKTLFGKMVGTFMLIAVAIGAAWVACLVYFYQRSDKASTAHSLANEVEIWMLQARRNEKDFQLRDLRAAQLYTDGASANLTLHEASVAGLLKAISSLDALHQAGVSAKTISDLREAVHVYDESFTKLVSRYRERGWADWGAEGELRAAAHDIEQRLSGLGNPRLEIALLGARRHEKDYLLRGDEGSISQLMKQLDDLSTEATRLREPARSAILAGVNAYSTAFQKYVLIQKEIGLSETEGLQGAMRDAVHKVEPLVSAVVEGTRRLSQSERAFRELLVSVLVVMLLGLAAGGAAFSLFARSIASSVGKMVALLGQVAEGDLRAHVESRLLDQRDEIGVLGTALEGTSEKLRGVVATIQDSALQVAASSEQISRGAQSLAEGAQGQASTLEETSASVEELAGSVTQVSENARTQAAAVEQSAAAMTRMAGSIEEISGSLGQIAGLADRSVSSSREGSQAVELVVEGINRIAQSSQKIAGIVTVIAEIADQTNLLALNASIEAARAGEHGKGFAVVADEVGKLAEKSASSTKEIESLIRESAQDVDEGVKTAKGSQAAMEQIRAASEQVNATITGLSESVRLQAAAVKETSAALANMSEMSRSISAATEEQSQTARQVSAAVESVNELTQAAASAAEQMSTSTEQLSQMAQELQALVAQFKLEVAKEGAIMPGLEAATDARVIGEVEQ